MAVRTVKKVKSTGKPNLNHPTYYLNRELSWLQFNARVLEEALDKKNPLLERVKFLSIFGSNLDEFFMVRVSGLRRQMETGVIAAPPDGMTPVAQLGAIREQLEPMLAEAAKCWHRLHDQLAGERVEVLRYEGLDENEKGALRRRFEDEVLPVLTPLAVDPVKLTFFGSVHINLS